MIAQVINNEAVEGVSKVKRKAKRCPKCGIIKPVNEFYRNKARPDGRADWCKDCKKAHKYSKGKIEVVIPGQKQCTYCKVIKPESEFQRCGNRSDGLQARCKDCCRAIVADRNRRRKAERDAAARIDYKIFNYEQMDSVVREMAEVQLEIDVELKVCQQRVTRTIQESAEVLEPRRRRLQHFLTAIECYFIRESRVRATKQFRFGLVQCHRGNVNVELDVKQAEKCLGKP